MVKNVSKKVDLSEIFQVKRSGKDLDDFYYTFGKVHGIENIAFVDPDELAATKGNPVSIQRLVNKVDANSIPKKGSYD